MRLKFPCPNIVLRGAHQKRRSTFGVKAHDTLAVRGHSKDHHSLNPSLLSKRRIERRRHAHNSRQALLSLLGSRGSQQEQQGSDGCNYGKASHLVVSESARNSFKLMGFPPAPSRNSSLRLIDLLRGIASPRYDCAHFNAGGQVQHQGLPGAASFPVSGKGAGFRCGIAASSAHRNGRRAATAACAENEPPHPFLEFGKDAAPGRSVTFRHRDLRQRFCTC